MTDKAMTPKPGTVKPPKPPVMKKYTPEKADRICELIATGKSLVFACQDVGISYATAMQWLKDIDGLADMYAQAREHQADYLADDLLAIADDSGLTPEDRRVRIDARKWTASKLKPKKYGDRQAIDLTVTPHEQRLADLDHLDGHQP